MSEMYAFGAIGVLAAVAGARGSRTVAEPPPPGPGWIITRTLVATLEGPLIWLPSRRRLLEERLRREAWTWGGSSDYEFRIPEVHANDGTMVVSMVLQVWSRLPLDRLFPKPGHTLIRCFESVMTPLRAAPVGTEERRIGYHVFRPEVLPRITDVSVKVR